MREDKSISRVLLKVWKGSMLISEAEARIRKIFKKEKSLSSPKKEA